LLLQPGMQVEVMIQTGDRTAFQYLVQPIVESVNRAWRED
jgi:HlyD family secretion protein